MSRWLQVFTNPDLRRKILLVLGILFVYRILAAIPVPGVDPQALQDIAEGNQFFQLVDTFSGGGFSSFSIVMLSVAPYITASIIMQLSTVAFPQMKALQKEEGEQGRQQFNQYTRLLTVPLAILQSISVITLFRSQGIVEDLIPLEIITAISVITAGTVALMWLGEIITNQKIGNGISMIIFAGIISALPNAIQQFSAIYNPQDIPTYILYLVLIVLGIMGIVFVNEGQRNIPISYSKQARQSAMVRSQVDNYLPLKVNQAGVIPIIFALSIIFFPTFILQALVQSDQEWIRETSQNLLTVWTDDLFLSIGSFVLVFAFTYFYTSIIFDPHSIAENLQRRGGFITGIRPGEQTAEYLSYVSKRIILFGASFLGVIAVVPFVLTAFTGQEALAIGGTSLLIVVSVVVETMKQLDAQIIVRDYENL